LKLKQPVPLPDGTPVRVTITPVGNDDPLEAVIGICKGGPHDGADNHDKYIYGPAPTKPPKAAKQTAKNRN
jgi:predicted DNA-binding antitoxin AbrB/MazE fold protein